MATAAPKRSIFRGKALQKYVQNQEKTVLPRIVAPPVFLFCWILLIILIAAGLVAWWGQVPFYVTGPGVILDGSVLPGQGNDEAVAVVVLPASVSGNIRVGLSTQVHIGQAGPQLTCTVDAVNANILSPSQIHQQYGLTVTDPSEVISIKLGSGIPRHTYAGSPVQAQIHIGSQRLLSFFPLFHDLLKEA
jgi:hypothetical protein